MAGCPSCGIGERAVSRDGTSHRNDLAVDHVLAGVHPNETLVRDFYEVQGRYYTGEASAEAVEALLSDDIAWHVPGRNAIAGDYHGKREVLDYFRRRRDKARRSLRIMVRRTLADEEFVMQLAAGRVQLGGAVREWETVGVYRIADERIAECWLVPFDQYAFDEIWS
jgi:ketosteroid isomerase-like protein